MYPVLEKGLKSKRTVKLQIRITQRRNIRPSDTRTTEIAIQRILSIQLAGISLRNKYLPFCKWYCITIKALAISFRAVILTSRGHCSSCILEVASKFGVTALRQKNCNQRTPSTADKISFVLLKLSSVRAKQ